jgi:hypothetical protein
MRLAFRKIATPPQGAPNPELPSNEKNVAFLDIHRDCIEKCELIYQLLSDQ